MWKYEKLIKLSLLYNWVARFTCIDDIKEIVRNMYVESARLVEWFYNKTRWVIVLRVTLEKWESIYIVFWKKCDERDGHSETGHVIISNFQFRIWC